MDLLFDRLDGISAEFSDDEKYRYTLTRRWSDGPCVAFLMFNPSTATATSDDPTIRKCIGFAQRWKYGRLIILNLFAYRSPDPRAIRKLGLDAVGPDNGMWIIKSLETAKELICAWGCAQHTVEIDARVNALIQTIKTADYRFPINCLGYRLDGHPRHPLMLRYDTPRIPFKFEH